MYLKNQDSRFYWKGIIYGHTLDSNIKIGSKSRVEQILVNIFKCKTVFIMVFFLGNERGQNKKKLSTQDRVYDKDSYFQSSSTLADWAPKADCATKPNGLLQTLMTGGKNFFFQISNYKNYKKLHLVTKNHEY